MIGSPTHEVSTWDIIVQGPLTEQVIRQLYQPSHCYRISRYQYPAGSELIGAMQSATCYVMCGSCRYDFGETVELTREQFARLPAGRYRLTVLGEEDLVIVLVWKSELDGSQ